MVKFDDKMKKDYPLLYAEGKRLMSAIGERMWKEYNIHPDRRNELSKAFYWDESPQGDGFWRLVAHGAFEEASDICPELFEWSVPSAKVLEESYSKWK